MVRIILVHGAWGVAGVWDALIPLLSAAGHEVSALTLPGHTGHATPPHTVGLMDYARAIADAIGDRPAILVGHSMGGMAITAAAQLVPEKVEKLIYLAAFLPKDGDSLLSLIKRQDLTIGNAVRPGAAVGTTVLDPDTAHTYLFHDASPEQRSLGLSQNGVQPNAPQTDRIEITSPAYADIPKAYILCDDDRTLTPALQAEMAHATPGVDIVTLEAGHYPQLTAPEKLAPVILDLI